MARIGLEEIRDRVRHDLDESFLAPFVRAVAVEPADDLADDTLLRVLVSIHDPDRVDVRATNDLVRHVRMGIMADDDRFLVFQFAEAA